MDGTAEMQPILSTSAVGEWPPRTGANLLPGTLPTLSGGGLPVPNLLDAGWLDAGVCRAKAGRRSRYLGRFSRWRPPPFLVTPFDEHSPRLSPDGKWLAYVSNESGRSDVYVQPFPGPGPKWLVSTDGGTNPVWAKSGGELFFRRARQMMLVSVVLREEFFSSRPQRLFDLPFDARDNQATFDASPEGTWFLTSGSDRGAPPPELHMVLDWFNELRSRQP